MLQAEDPDGGSVNIFYNTLEQKGTIYVNGGLGGTKSSSTTSKGIGGAGGSGTVSMGSIATGTYASNE